MPEGVRIRRTPHMNPGERTHMNRLCLSLIAAASVAAATFVAGGSAGTNAGPKSGGKVVFGAEQEPPCLNLFLAGCANTWTLWLNYNTQFRSLLIQKPDYTFRPDLADSAKLVSRKPETLAIHIRKNAVWSDGVPVTWKDFQYLWQQIVNPKNDIAARSGFDSIRSVKPTSKDGKSFTIVFKKPFAP